MNARTRGRGARVVPPPSPSELVPSLSDEQVEVLGEIGRHWSRVYGDRGRWHGALPVDPALGGRPEEPRPGRFVRVVPIGERRLEAPPEFAAPPSRIGRALVAARHAILGPPLRSSALAVERMRKLVALPVLSADALSSVAYGPEAMIAVLVLAGAPGLRLQLPIAVAIAVLMLTVGLSYRQTIRAYPHGGGSYIVASDNLGRLPGLVAAAGLMTDYILTVAVSVAAGVAAITSALPSLEPDTVALGLGTIALLLAGNLRGVRQAGLLFAAPTYAFSAAVLVMVGVGLGQAAGRGFHATPAPALHASAGLGVLLVLRAFSSGATAMTGIEAISDSVPVFRRPEWRNARTTLACMIALLVVLFAGTVALIHFDGVVTSPHETILSQLAHRSFGSGAFYGITQAATAAILLLAANTAFNDFPRVLFLLARDRYAPRIFLRMGDRLAFSNGIILLAVGAAAIFAAFDGRTNPLIPLFAVGVFVSFTLSQSGMVVHWWRGREPGWRRSMAINATGAALSAIVFVIAAITKFVEGAWVAICVIALIVTLAILIRRHYARVTAALALRAPPEPGPRARRRAQPRVRDAAEVPVDSETEESPEQVENLLILPIAALHLASMRTLAYAASLGQPLLAIHISPTEEEAERFVGYWRAWGDHVPLEVVVSPYRAVVPLLTHYVESLHRQCPELTLTVLFEELVVPHLWQRALHNGTAPRIRRALRPLPKIVVATVPFHLPR